MRPQAIESKGTIPAISLAFLCIIYLVQAATKIDQISSHQVLPEVDSSSIENSVPREIEETLVKRPAGDTIRDSQDTKKLRRARDSSQSDELTLFETPVPSARSSGGQRNDPASQKKTLYVCEGTQENIECPAGQSIQLIRANYGRFSIQKCNDVGHLDWSINCTSPASFQIIENSCQGKQACRLLASNAIFGDACPGTQKYLEVHYQCVLQSQNISRHQPAFGLETSKLNVISNQQQQQQQQQTNQDYQASSEIPSSQHFGLASSASPPTLAMTRPHGPVSVETQQQPAFPAWMPPLRAPSTPPLVSTLPTSSVFQHSGVSAPALPSVARGPPLRCPEIVWRQIRWPATEVGQVMRMPCPSHAQPGNPLDPFPASLACQMSGQWSQRVQAARCQSLWLQNLTQRLEVGDSPLSALGELSHRTRTTVNYQPGSFPLPSSGAGLFGDDLLEISRIVRRLVDEMGDLLGRIVDDKQRANFASELVQSLAELVNNLASEFHQDAWSDLTELHGASRQQVAGQLVQALEGASVLLAAHIQQQPLHLSSGRMAQQALDSSETLFSRQTENVIVSIRSISLQLNDARRSNRSLELSLSNELNMFGTKWTNLDQQFTLHLRASEVPVAIDEIGNSNQADSSGNSQQALKLVLVLLRGIGAQMGPTTTLDSPSNHLVVNSNLISLSMVSDSRSKLSSMKVDLSAPLELVFRHSQPVNPSSSSSARCVFWDARSSDWLNDGCQLIGSNQTHSICSCNHLTTFALLSEWDPDDSSNQQQQQHLDPSNPQANVDLQAKVQLESIENELILPFTSSSGQQSKLLYLGKMLDGQIFATGPTTATTGATNSRLLIHVSCLLATILLALQLSASLYNRFHARRLLASIPLHPAPSLLVTSSQTLQSRANGGGDTYNSSIMDGNDYASAVCKAAQSIPALEQSYWQTNPNSHWQSNRSQLDFDRRHRAKQNSIRAPIRIANLRIPIHLMVKLFTIQLLLILLVESQTYFIRPFRFPFITQISKSPAHGGAKLTPPIGRSTWLLITLLYYLIASVTCWLFSQFIRLNMTFFSYRNLVSSSDTRSRQLRSACLFGSGGASISDQNSALPGGESTSSSDGSDHSDKTHTSHYDNSSASVVALAQSGANPVGATICNPRSNQTAAAAIYGGLQNCYATTGNGHVCSPGSSVYSSIEHPRHQLQHLRKLSSSSSYPNSEQAVGLAHFGLVHLAPIVMSLIQLWFSSGSASTTAINELTYVTSFGLQLASWPLLIEATWLQFSLLLYAGPIICSILLAFALVALRSPSGQRRNSTLTTSSKANKIANPYGSSSALDHGQNPLSNSLANLASSNGNPFGGQTGKIHSFGAKLNEQRKDGCSILMMGKQQQLEQQATNSSVRRAKFVYLMLLILLGLHSICWISFLVHTRQSITTKSSETGSNYRWQANQLIYAFASSNLIMSLLVCWCERRNIRRAIQFAGLNRFIWLLSCHQHQRDSSLEHQTFEHSLYQQRRQAANGIRQRQRLQMNADSNANKLAGEIGAQTSEISPSSHSLFLVSNQQEAASNSIYGNYQQQQQQHLYQPVYGEPTMALNERGAHIGAQRQPMMQQLIHQQHSFTLNRPLGQPHQQQQPLMVLDAGNMMKHQQQFCQFDQSKTISHQRVMQHQQQQLILNQGEVEGPLVALSGGQTMEPRRLAPPTFSPNQHQAQYQQRHQAGASSGASIQKLTPYEHQLFSSNQRSSPSIQQTNSDFRFVPGSSTGLGNDQAGYSMRIQQQSQHFRRGSQQKSLMNYPAEKSGESFDCAHLNRAHIESDSNSSDNIYDTANNYALVQ